MTNFLNKSNQEILNELKDLYLENRELNGNEILSLRKFETHDYAILGLIGLLIYNKAYIALGQKQVFEIDVQNWCNQILITQEDLELIAEKYLDDKFEQEPEHVLRYVMNEFPKKK